MEKNLSFSISGIFLYGLFSYSSVFAVTCEELKKFAEEKKIKCGDSKSFEDLRSAGSSYRLRVEQRRYTLQEISGEDYGKSTPQELNEAGEGATVSHCTIGKENFDHINIGQGDNPMDCFFFPNSLNLLNLTVQDGNVFVDKKFCDVALDIWV